MNRRVFRAAVAATAVCGLAVVTGGAAPTSAAPSGADPLWSAAPAGAATSSPLADRLIVVWKSGSSPAARTAARGAAQTRVVRTLGDADFELVRPASGQGTQAALDALAADSRVLSVERDGSWSTHAATNDPDLKKLWGLKNTGKGIAGVKKALAGADANVFPAWSTTKGSPSVVAADIDSGYRFDAPDLGPVAYENPGEIADNGIDDDANGYIDDSRGWDFVGKNADSPSGDKNPTDDDLVTGGHGAHTAGTLGAKGDNGKGITGVAQNIRIMPLRVCSYAPSLGGGTCPYSSLAEAINYAGDNGARVANMSLGGTSPSPAVLQAMANHPETLYVISAGNANTNNDVSSTYPCVYNPDTDTAVPTAIDNVICVAATNQSDKRAGFSNYGATTVDLGAPGTETYSVYPKQQSYFKESFSKKNFAKRWKASPKKGWGRASKGDGPLKSPGMNDSPGKKPKANQERIVVLKARPKIPGKAGGCTVSFDYVYRDVTGGIADVAVYLGNGVSRQRLAAPSGALTQGFDHYYTAPFDADGQKIGVALYYRGSSSPSAKDGFWIDNVKVVCNKPMSAAPGYAYLEGTSMAAPHVTGAAALLFSAAPGASVTTVRNAILNAADPVSSLSGATSTGGRLNVAAAIRALP